MVILAVLCVLFATGTINLKSNELSNEVNNQDNITNDDIVCEENNNVTQTYNYNLAKRGIIQVLEEGYLKVLIDTNGNAYLYTIGNLDYESDENIKRNLTNLQQKFEKYSPKGYTYRDGSTELMAIKLNVTNVLTSYYVHMGNGGNSYFVFVKENGKLSYLSYDKIIYNGEVELKDISDLENVVSVVENTYSMTPYIITSSGNKLSLFNYIK